MSAIHRATHLLLVAALTFGLVMGALISAGPASAHATRIASDPAEDASLPQPPQRVSATFNEPMQPRFAAMTLIGPDGAQWADGEPAVDDAVISVAVRPGGPPGTYTVNYRATSADGHVVTGSWSYQVVDAAPAPPEPTPAPAAPATTTAAPAGDTSPDDVPVWPFVAAVTVIVAGGAVWAVRRRS